MTIEPLSVSITATGSGFCGSTGGGCGPLVGALGLAAGVVVAVAAGWAEFEKLGILLRSTGFAGGGELEAVGNVISGGIRSGSSLPFAHAAKKSTSSKKHKTTQKMIVVVFECTSKSGLFLDWIQLSILIVNVSDCD